MMADLDAAATELSAASRQLRYALVLAAGYVEAAAAEGDQASIALNRLLCASFDRLTAANILAHTEKENHRHG